MRRRRSGMTLLELVVALTVTAIAMTSGYAAFGFLADRRMAAVTQSSGVSRDAAVRRTIAEWVAGARLTIEEDEIVFRGIDAIHKQGAEQEADDELTFFTSAPTPVGEAGTIVQLHVVRGDSIAPANRGLVAELVGWRDTRHATVVLDSTVTAFDVRFLSSALGQREWLTSWISSTVLPAGARIELRSSRDSLPPLLRLPITVSLENGR
jgi:prepilin-type N-terminal cleavage/methylation domain-containing protein